MDTEQVLSYLKNVEKRIGDLENHNVLFMLERQINKLVTETQTLVNQINKHLNENSQQINNFTIQLEVLKYYVSSKLDLDTKQMLNDYELLLTYMKENQLTIEELLSELLEKLKGEPISTYFKIKNINNEEEFCIKTEDKVNTVINFSEKNDKVIKDEFEYSMVNTNKKIEIDEDGTEWVSLK